MHLILKYLKKAGSLLAIYCLCFSVYANSLCAADQKCQQQLALEKAQLLALAQHTSFVSNAPQSILNITHTLWQNRLNLCKTKQCISQQISQRTQELNEFATLNQNLTQHFIKYKHGKVSTQQVYLQIHQLEQNKVKIDGYAYSSPHSTHKHFLAYSQSADLAQITNNEDGCIYYIKISKALLNIQTEQKQCRTFAGNYRRYD